MTSCMDMVPIRKCSKGGDAGSLFYTANQTHSIDEIAEFLAINKGTIERWLKQNLVPNFYKNDFLRLLGRRTHTGIEESDQFYTPPKLAKYCVSKFYSVMNEYKIDTSDYIFVEPSAGCGFFYQNLPSKKRIAIDIDPQPIPNSKDTIKGIIKKDFLLWDPPNEKSIIIGNPPFGRNGKTALDFVFKGLTFADYIAFILPPTFNSTGKGSCYNRLIKNGYALLHTESLDNSEFIKPNGSPAKIATLFQVWAKSPPDNYKPVKLPTCADFVDIHYICIAYKPSRPSSNLDLIGKCDLYIPRTFWAKAPIHSVRDFGQVLYQDGYGIVIKKNKMKVMKALKSIDWRDSAHISSNNSLCVRKDIIIQELVGLGFVDNE